MRRRGQALLVVFGVTLAVFLLLIISYLLVNMFTENNNDVQLLNREITVFNSYTAQVDTNIISFASSTIATLGAHLNATCSLDPDYPPFMKAYDNYVDYLAVWNDTNSTYPEKFAICDVRGKYLSALATIIEAHAQNLSTGYFMTEIGSVPIRKHRIGNTKTLPDLKTNPYYYSYPASDEATYSKFVFISTPSNFTVIIPDLITSYDPGYKVCYDKAKMRVYVSTSCPHPVDDFVKLRDEHQLKITTDLRPIYVYDYLAVRYALWNRTVHNNFDTNAIVIPFDLNDDAEKSKIWHVDPIVTYIPPDFVGRVYNLRYISLPISVATNTKVYTGYTTHSDGFGKTNWWVSKADKTISVNIDQLKNFIGYLTYYPSFSRRESRVNDYPVVFKSSCNEAYTYDLSCGFIGVNNYVFVNRGDAPDLASIDFDSYDTVFSNFIDYSINGKYSGKPFHSVVGSYLESYYYDFDTYVSKYSWNYVAYFDLLSGGYPFGESDFPNSLVELINENFASSSPLTEVNSLHLPIDAYFRERRPLISFARLFGNPAIKDTKGNLISLAGKEQFTPGMGERDFFFTLILNSKGNLNYGAFSPFNNSNYDPASNLDSISTLKLGNYTIRDILGHNVNSEDFKGIWASLPSISEVSFKIHDVRSDYYVKINLDDAVKVMLVKWQVGASVMWPGIENGTCCCRHQSGNCVQYCTLYVNPDKGTVGDIKYWDVPSPYTGMDAKFTMDKVPNGLVIGIIHSFDDGRTRLYVVNAKGNDTDISKTFRMYNLTSPMPAKWDSDKVFLRRGDFGYDSPGCGDPIGKVGADATAVKVFVGVKQYYKVKAITRFYLDMNVTGRLYGLDTYALKRILAKFLGFDDPNTISFYESYGSVFGYWINGYFHNVSEIAGDITEMIGNSRNNNVVLVQPEVIFSSNLYQYIPFKVEFKNVPVYLLYKFYYGYPGKVDLNTDVDIVDDNNGGELSYNWFDITGIYTKDDISNAIDNKDYSAIKNKAIDYVRRIENSYGIPYCLSPSKEGGVYKWLTPEGLSSNTHIHVKVVGSLDNVQVVVK